MCVHTHPGKGVSKQVLLLTKRQIGANFLESNLAVSSKIDLKDSNVHNISKTQSLKINRPDFYKKMYIELCSND